MLPPPLTALPCAAHNVQALAAAGNKSAKARLRQKIFLFISSLPGPPVIKQREGEEALPLFFSFYMMFFCGPYIRAYCQISFYYVFCILLRDA
jgi:hypothetical protein